jgi:hypothetical protein
MTSVLIRFKRSISIPMMFETNPEVKKTTFRFNTQKRIEID